MPAAVVNPAADRLDVDALAEQNIDQLVKRERSCWAAEIA